MEIIIVILEGAQIASGFILLLGLIMVILSKTYANKTSGKWFLKAGVITYLVSILIIYILEIW
jgi:hypothetical protein